MIPGEFTQNVWKLARSIPSGRVTTYGILATVAGGHPMMAQMITHILSKAPNVDSLPFHRIVYANGRVWLGSTKPGEGGLDPKNQKSRLKLYQEEGIMLDKNYHIINFEKVIYYFEEN